MNRNRFLVLLSLGGCIHLFGVSKLEAKDYNHHSINIEKWNVASTITVLPFPNKINHTGDSLPMHPAAIKSPQLSTYSASTSTMPKVMLSCPPTFTQVPPICSGNTLGPLPTISNNGISGTWSPAINNSATTTYTFTPNAGTGTNLVTNSSFSSGNSGFTSDYIFLANAGLNGVQGAYGINTAANNWFQFFQPCTATSTTSGGSYMIVDGSIANGGNDMVWGQNIAVTPNTTYTFSFWLQTIAMPNPAEIEVLINGVSIGIATAPSVNCEWTFVTFSWNSGANGTAAISMFDRVTASGGNDFGLDDISFFADVCADPTTMTIVVNNNPTLSVVPGCAGGPGTGTITTTATASSGGTLTYTINGVADGDGNQTGLANGNYTVVVTESPSGCTNSQTVVVSCTCPTITVSGAATLCQTAAASTYTQSGGAMGGTWTVTPGGAGTMNGSGAFIPNASFSGAATITYTVAGCTGSRNITINAATVPIFTQISPICNGATSIPTLPTSSTNGISGTWNPATVSNTATVTYTFTPNASVCAITTTMSITVRDLPSISVVPGCAGGPGTGTITTTATASNGGTLSYAINGVVDFDGNQTGLANGFYTVVVTESPSGCTNSETVFVDCNCPTITVSGAATLCQTSAASTYTQSGGAAGGAWTVTPVGAGTITAGGSFTPNASFTGAAAITYTLSGCTGAINITINAPVVPTFTQISPICNGATPLPTLPTSSTNSINGTWNPATVSNTAPGTYTFTPSANACASTTTMVIGVTGLPTISVVPGCTGGPGTGTITTTATAGNGGALSYTINGVADLDGNQTGLANGTYTVVVTEAPSGCTNTQTVIVNCNCPTITVSGAATLCQTAAATTYTQSGGSVGGAWTVAPAGAGTITAGGSFTPNATFSGNAIIDYTVAGCVGAIPITINAPVVPAFAQISAICTGATPVPTLLTSSINGISGTWNPTTVSNTATGTYIFTPSASVCATTATMTVTVNALPTISVVSGCAGGANSGTITTSATASNGGTLTYTINGVADLDGNQTGLANNSYTIVVTESPSGCTNSQTVVVNCNCPTITVSGAASLCQTSAASTYTQSGGAAGGTWTVTPAGAGTITAGGVFTPNATFSGAASITYTETGCVGSLNITINALVVPVFTQIPPICNGATPIPTLLASSTNGVTGIWNPTTVSNTASGTYTFTASAGVCATTATMMVSVSILPTISVVSGCTGGANSGTITTTATAGSGGTLTYAINGVADADGNQTGLANNSYTVLVTESPSGCTNSQTALINCNCPTIAVSGASTLCQTAAASTYTQNGGAAGGTWTVTPSGAGTITNGGIFTPNATFSGAATITYTEMGCVGSLNITINALVVPAFTQISPICSGATPIPALPASSTNGITGTWSPAIVSNTANGTYTFTASAGGCATTATMTINVRSLPTISVVSGCAGGPNSGTITTSATPSNGGTLTYTINGVADLDGNQTGLANNSYTIVVTESPSGCTNSQTVLVNCGCPTITVLGAATLCQTAAATAYTQSGGAAGGTWTVTPAGAGTITAGGSFTPNAGFSGNATINYTVAACVGALTITINPLIIPVFTQIPQICNGAAPIPILPTTSINGIAGTWNPTTVSNTATGAYTFTPNVNVCATSTGMTVIVNTLPTISVLPGCTGGANTGTITTSATAGNGGTLTYSINGVADADGNQVGLANNSYTVVVTESPSGCTNSQTVLVNCGCPTITVAGAATLCQSSATTIYTQNGGAAGGTWSVTPSIAGIIFAGGVFTPNPTFSGAATITYTVSGCAGALNLAINAPTLPTFTQVGPYCSGEIIPDLPTSSTNATPIPGTWSPAINNTTTTTYTFTPSAVAGTNNLVVNGNFSAGNTGFNSAYSFITNAGNNGVQGAYGIDISANAWFQFFAPCTAVSTNSGGSFMIVDGSVSNGGNDMFWGQNFAVMPNQLYTFSFWLQTIAMPNPAQIEVTINGTSIGTTTAPTTNCQWKLVTFTWNSGANTTANIAMYDRLTTNNGNDFGLDDISFFANNNSCIANTTMTIIVNDAPTLNVVPGCDGGQNSGTLTTTAVAANFGMLSFTINGISDADGNQTGLANNSYTVVVTESPSGCTNSQTVSISCGCPPISISGDTTLCQGASATNYTQSGGNTGGVWTVTPISAGTINVAGSYLPNAAYSGVVTVTYTEGACVGTFEVTINPGFTATLVANNPLCAGEKSGSIVIVTPNANPPYLSQLNGNDIGNTGIVEDLAEGSYMLQIVDALGCTWDSTFSLVDPLPFVLDLGPDRQVAYGDEITIDAVMSLPIGQISEITWNPAASFNCLPGQICLEQTLSIDNLTPLQITATAIDTNGCIATDVLNLEIKLEFNIYIPNVFSPSSNSLNSIFSIYASPNVLSVKSFNIYDRWGNLIFTDNNFEPNDPTRGWDGTYKGKKLGPAVFVYAIVVELADGSTELKTGDVTIVR